MNIETVNIAERTGAALFTEDKISGGFKILQLKEVSSVTQF